jgi:hypothetical protein
MVARFLTVLVSRSANGPAVIVGSGLCRCEPGTQHKYGRDIEDVFGVAGPCPIKKILVEADSMVAAFPGGYGQVRTRGWDTRLRGV